MILSSFIWHLASKLTRVHSVQIQFWNALVTSKKDLKKKKEEKVEQEYTGAMNFLHSCITVIAISRLCQEVLPIN